MRRIQVLGPLGRAACGIRYLKGEYAGRVFLNSRAINRPDWRDGAVGRGTIVDKRNRMLIALTTIVGLPIVGASVVLIGNNTGTASERWVLSV